MTAVPYSRISELSSHSGQTVRVRGWVTHVRSSGKVAFVVMRDGTGLLQAVLVKNAVSPEVWERFGKLTQETSIEVEGKVRPDARAPGGFELGVKDLSIYGESPIANPIPPKNKESTSSWTTGPSGCAHRGSAPSRAFEAKSSRRSAISSTNGISHSWILRFSP